MNVERWINTAHNHGNDTVVCLFTSNLPFQLCFSLSVLLAPSLNFRRWNYNFFRMFLHFISMKNCFIFYSYSFLFWKEIFLSKWFKEKQKFSILVTIFEFLNFKEIILRDFHIFSLLPVWKFSFDMIYASEVTKIWCDANDITKLFYGTTESTRFTYVNSMIHINEWHQLNVTMTIFLIVWKLLIVYIWKVTALWFFLMKFFLLKNFFSICLFVIDSYIDRHL